jgi:hypothetical protein
MDQPLGWLAVFTPESVAWPSLSATAISETALRIPVAASRSSPPSPLHRSLPQGLADTMPTIFPVTSA